MKNGELISLLEEGDEDAEVTILISTLPHDIEIDYNGDGISLIPIDQITHRKAQLEEEAPEAW